MDWILISKSEAGGSWNSYDQHQKTISPVEWMALPDAPISGDNEGLTQYKTAHMCKTDAISLCGYYQNYANTRLSLECMLFNSSVTRAYPQDNLWQVELDDNTRISCQYLVLAISRTAKLLNINGENNNPNVSHTSAQAIRNISRLKSGAGILVIGTGLSAADTMMKAMDKGLKVTHILPREHTKLGVKYRPDKSHNTLKNLTEEDYKEHARLAKLISGATKSENYQQLINYQLLKIEDRKCTLNTDNKEEQIVREFDHYAILIGSEPDFSFMKNTDGEPLNFEARNLVPETMETTVSNLFLAGSCSGEKFQRFSLGHSVSVAETIKDRASKEKQKEKEERHKDIKI